MEKQFEKSYMTVYGKCLETTRNLNFKIDTENIDTGLIEFNVGWSFWSWGEKFKITITELAPSKTKVNVSSESSASFQVYDWNKNNENVKNFFKELKKLLQS